MKLGEITIRRVIILVLTMLLVYPFLMPVNQDQHTQSAFYAADNVFQSFRNYVGKRDSLSRRQYENAYLKHFFYHNWYATKGFCPEGKNCGNMYYAHAFWIGIAGKNAAELNELAGLAAVSRSAVRRWTAEQNEFSDYIYNYGSMPEEGLQMLASPWSIDACKLKKFKR